MIGVVCRPWHAATRAEGPEAHDNPTTRCWRAGQAFAFTETCVVADLDAATVLSAADLGARQNVVPDAM